MSTSNQSDTSQPLPLTSSPLSTMIDSLPPPYREFMRPFSPIVDPSIPLFSNGRQSYFPATSLGSSRYLSCRYRFQALRTAVDLAWGLVFSERGLRLTVSGMDMSDAQLADDLSPDSISERLGTCRQSAYTGMDHKTKSRSGTEEMMARLMRFKEETSIPIVLGGVNRRRWTVYTANPLEIHLDMNVSHFPTLICMTCVTTV